MTQWMTWSLSTVVLLAWLSGCATLRDDMVRAENQYEDARYENALVWLEDLEKDIPRMDTEMQARYYFLRGMSAFRVNRRNEALHYLALSREVAGDQGRGLRADWTTTLERALAELTPTDASFHARSRTEQEAASPTPPPITRE